MRLFKKIPYLLLSVFVITFIALIIAMPSVCKEGVIKGILICGRIIIPSLYPFTVCVLLIMKLDLFSYLAPLNKITKAVFGITAEQFSLFFLSLIGGYPVGAKLIDEYVAKNKISKSQGRAMLNYCVNGGPAFLIGAVGAGIIGSKSIGYILLVSHIAASLVICFINRFFKTDNIVTKLINPKTNLADSFVSASAEAAATVFNICSFIILFSAINAYLLELSKKLPFIYKLIFITEVTNGITQTENILFISFLLGFSGICIWCQILASVKSFKLNLLSFAAFRLLHGTLSVGFTLLLIKLTGVTVPVFSNNISFNSKTLYSTPSLALSLICMTIIFLISISCKKHKILEDII